MGVDGNTFRFDFDYRPNEGLPFAAHRRLHEAGPVVWSDSLNGWMVSSYDGVRAVLSDLDRFTSAGTPVAEAFGGEAILVTDTPLHNIVRAVWAKYVSRAAMAARAAELEGNAERVLEAARPRLESGETINFMPLFRQYIMTFIASSFGVPSNRFNVFEFYGDLSADTPALALEKGSEAEKQHLVAKNAVLDLVREQVAERKARAARGENPTDLIALMAAAEGRDGISAANVVDNIFNFMLGALDTTEKWFGNILVKLCSDPKLHAEISADPSLIELLIEEVMRFDTVAQVIQRKVKAGGAEVGGKQMREGDSVFLMLGAANHDAAEYKNPGTFDVRRPASLNVGFGFGLHHCLGIHIARQEAIALTKVAIKKFPTLRVVACDYGNSWALWGPRALHMALGK
jgi:cytochrome P450